MFVGKGYKWYMSPNETNEILTMDLIARFEVIIEWKVLVNLATQMSLLHAESVLFDYFRDKKELRNNLSWGFRRPVILAENKLTLERPKKLVSEINRI